MGKMPSVGVIIESKPKGLPKGPPPMKGGDPSRDALSGHDESQEQETNFACPACGCNLAVQKADEEEADEMGGMTEGMSEGKADY
jgi:hypothetical protein